jgi:hypothetical protein
MALQSRAGAATVSQGTNVQKLTVDQALALIEQERLDELAEMEPGDEFYECAAYVLASELRRIRADAERYRWLRGRAWPFTFQGDTPESADAAIDEAMESDPYALNK